MDKAKGNTADMQYRQLFENPNESVITPSHLFDELHESGLALELGRLVQ